MQLLKVNSACFAPSADLKKPAGTNKHKISSIIQVLESVEHLNVIRPNKYFYSLFIMFPMSNSNITLPIVILQYVGRKGWHEKLRHYNKNKRTNSVVFTSISPSKKSVLHIVSHVLEVSANQS